ncbi:MAG: TetR/AcrR family transcriptional regulator [Chitinophagales bacterium]|nr:TetR/AcrR family transcriptional regulator [Chitinophagales bacterium]
MNNGTDMRGRILQAATELFFSYGIRSITMDDIARHLSISKKTIYQFFEDKDEIVQTLCHIDCDQNVLTMQQISDQSKDAIDEIMQSMEFLAAVLSRLNPNLIYDLQKFHPAAWSEFQKFREDHLKGSVEKNLRKGIRQGYYRSEINVKILARLRIEEVVLGMNPIIYPPSNFNLREVELELLVHFLYGIITLEGLKLLNDYKTKKKIKKLKVLA